MLNKIVGAARIGKVLNVAVFAAVLGVSGGYAGASVVSLGASSTFAVLGGSTVTNTGASVIVGDVGVSPGTSIVFGPGVVTDGSLHAGDALATQAHAAAANAYGQLVALPFTTANNLSNEDLGGMTLTPGVYHFDTAAELHGALTLNGNGEVDPLFVFQIGTTLTTATGASVILSNGANADNIYFQIGTSATFGIGTAFAGTVIASASDSLTTGVSVNGRVFAIDGAVTMDTNAVTSFVPAPSAVFASPLLMAAGLLKRRTRRSA